MINKINLRLILSLFVLISIFTVSLPTNISAQTATKQVLTSDLQQAVARIEEKVEARRKELGIPGMSLVISKTTRLFLSKASVTKTSRNKFPSPPTRNLPLVRLRKPSPLCRF